MHQSRSIQLAGSIQLGPHRLKSAIALAPMAGLTDVPFRTLAWRYGAGHMVSEMVSDKPELWETGKSRLRRVPVPGVTPVAVQIAGADPGSMAEAARRHVADGVDVIDINFGCPAKKVCRKAAGSALLEDLDLLARIVEGVTSAVSVPVSVKTRTGLAPGDGLGCAAARMAQEAGASMLVVHARSRACRFVGPIDHASVGAVKSAVGIPVLVNGDIANPSDMAHALEQTGADGVMVGRGAFGRPWVFQELLGGPSPDIGEQWSVVLEHVGLMHEFYGERAGVRIARKHIEAYGKTMGFDTKLSLRFERSQQQLDWLTDQQHRQLAIAA